MSADEVVVTFVAVVVGPGLWLAGLSQWRELPRGQRAVNAIAGTLAICGAVLFAVLRKMAASDVVHAPNYVFMYLMLGFAWIHESCAIALKNAVTMPTIAPHAAPPRIAKPATI